MSSKYKLGTIILTKRDGTEEHEARIIGHFGVFSFQGTIEQGMKFVKKTIWQVVHIPTGKVAKHNLCCYRSAKGLAEALQQFNWDWKLTETGRPPDSVMDDFNTARKVVMSWTCPAKKRRTA